MDDLSGRPTRPGELCNRGSAPGRPCLRARHAMLVRAAGCGRTGRPVRAATVRRGNNRASTFASCWPMFAATPTPFTHSASPPDGARFGTDCDEMSPRPWRPSRRHAARSTVASRYTHRRAAAQVRRTVWSRGPRPRTRGLTTRGGTLSRPGSRPCRPPPERGSHRIQSSPTTASLANCPRGGAAASNRLWGSRLGHRHGRHIHRWTTGNTSSQRTPTPTRSPTHEIAASRLDTESVLLPRCSSSTTAMVSRCSRRVQGQGWVGGPLDTATVCSPVSGRSSSVPDQLHERGTAIKRYSAARVTPNQQPRVRH